MYISNVISKITLLKFTINNKIIFACLLLISAGWWLFSNKLVTDYATSTRVSSYYIDKCNPFSNNESQHTVLIENSIFPRTVPLNQNKSINFTCLNQNSDVKVILFWTQPTWFKDNRLGRITPFKSCPVRNCELTNNKSRINESDFVITHMWDKIQKLPEYRPDGQKWIFMLYEPPTHMRNISMYNGNFNLTSTYKIDSDFPVTLF